MEFHAYISGAETMDGVWSDEWFNAILTNKIGDGQYKLLVGKAQAEGGRIRYYEARYVRSIDDEKISLQDIVGGNQRKESRNLMEHEVMGAPIGAEAAGEQKQTIEKARTKIIDAAPLMERLKAAIAFGNEKGLPTDELEQVLADIEGMEEYKGDAIECAIKALSEPLQPWEVLAAQAVLPQPEQHIDADGTLWITVIDIERVKRVIVDEEKSKFCKQFYQDAQPEQHYDEWCDSCKEYDKEKHSCPRWNKVIKNTVEELKSAQHAPCEDTVSRLGAISHFREIADATNPKEKYNEGFIDGLEFCIAHLSTMPPVTPKQAETECCTNCKYDGYGRIEECAICCYSYASHFAHK